MEIKAEPEEECSFIEQSNRVESHEGIPVRGRCKEEPPWELNL